MTREEWLRHAVEEIDATIFEGDLDLLNHDFQIACGRVLGKKNTECFQPSDVDDLSFFPTTISVNFTTKDPMDMLVALTYECIHAFFNVKSTNKYFKSLAEKYYFEEPYKEPNPSPYLKELLRSVYNKLIKSYGDFPGKPVVFPKKDKKEGKKNTIELFCPECGYTLKILRKVYDTYNCALPTCACGVKMAADLSDEKEE